ncbi:MAG: hypothetical protein IJV21_04455 [Lachnospiraceae bacterium]|nr:hypothetical protein [Lachnospiraceae bacterium]
MTIPCRRAFLKMSTGPEAFLALRNHFTTSHALLCVSHWVLGIGDRHLNNFMVSLETGGVIGIDFGHAFGSATQVSWPGSVLGWVCRQLCDPSMDSWTVVLL